jgi:hypothetical protein
MTLLQQNVAFDRMSWQRPHRNWKFDHLVEWIIFRRVFVFFSIFDLDYVAGMCIG